MNRNTIVILGGSLFVALILIVFVVLDRQARVVESWPSGGVASVDAAEYEWGNINIEGGNVNHTFVLKNTSSEPLELAGAVSSCMCTTATLEVDGVRSPEFGMHTRLGGWSDVVAPGDTFFVDVTFDPMAHGPDAVGMVTRTIDVLTSASPDGDLLLEDDRVPSGSIISLVVSGNVQYANEYFSQNLEEMERSYDLSYGSFSFSEDEHDFGTLKQSGGIVEYPLSFRYDGSVPVTVTDVVGSCACTTGKTDKQLYQPGDTGVLTIMFDPNLHEEPEGRFFKTVLLKTQPSQDEDVEVKLWAEIDLDLGPEAYKLQTHDE